jgi:hypothetical protein
MIFIELLNFKIILFIYFNLKFKIKKIRILIVLKL